MMATALNMQPIFFQIPEYSFSSFIKNPNQNDSGNFKFVNRLDA